MTRPIPIEVCEQIIYFYQRIQYIFIETGEIKIDRAIAKKAQELGIHWATAWRIILFAKEIGMVQMTEKMYK